MDSRLRWKPPRQVNPTTVNVPANFYGGTFRADEDVTLVMPTKQRTSSLNVTGGRHVRLIGGSTRRASTGAALRFTGVTGSVFIEGTEVENSLNVGDAINACGRQASDPLGATFPDVYLQNCRVVGVNGTNAGTHSDIYQPQGPVGRVLIDKLTGRSNYQGLFLRSEFPISCASLSRVNLSYEAGGDGNTFLLWHYTPATDQPFPMFLRAVYVQPRPGQMLAANAVYPCAGIRVGGVDVGAISTDGGKTAHWPANVTGYVIAGRPADDYVPAGLAGVGYVSPGYRFSCC